MSVTTREHLQGTISHLAHRRRQHAVEVARLDEILKALQLEVEALPRTEQIPFPPNDGQYVGISIRWAVLALFSESGPERQSLGRIADALRAGGATTKGQSFNSNVSAVLSVMVGKGELDKNEEGFALTGHGHIVWQGIRTSEKFAARSLATSLASEE